MGRVGTGTGMSAMGQMSSLDTVKTGTTGRTTSSTYNKVETSDTRYMGGHVEKELRNKVPS